MSRWQETFSPAFNNVNDPRSHCRYAVHLHSPYDLPCFSKPHELIEYLGYHSSSSANRLPVSHLKRDLSFLLSLPPSLLPRFPLSLPKPYARGSAQCSNSAYDIKMGQCFQIYACNGYRNDRQSKQNSDSRPNFIFHLKKFGGKFKIPLSVSYQTTNKAH